MPLNDMNDNRVIVLLTRKMTGEISKMEQQELVKLLAENPESTYYEEFIKELWSKEKDQQHDMQRSYQWHKKRHQEQLDFDKADDEEGVAETKRKKSWLFSRKMIFYSVAASMLCVLVVGVLWSRFIAEKDTGNHTAIVAEKGVRKQWTLPDGTKVWLNADSRLSYNDFNIGKQRLVNLEGEAYFDVTKDKNKPFIIKTDKISISVLGTTFNVKAYPNEQRTEATLLTGAIELSVNDRPKEKIILKPSEKIAVINNGEIINTREKQGNNLVVTISSLSKVHVDDQAYIQETSWIDNKLIFENETIEELLPKLERWYNVTIHVSDPKINHYRYTASIAGENITQLLDAMQLVKPFQYTVEDNEIVIY